MRNRYVLLADLAGIAVAAFGAFALRFDWWFVTQRREFVPFLLTALVLKPVVYHAFGLYRRYWPYASVRDLILTGFAVATSSVILALLALIAVVSTYVDGVSRSVLLIDFLLTMMAVSGIRLSIRAVGDARLSTVDRRQRPRSIKRVLVVGAGSAGTLVVREMQRNPHLGASPVGFLDDEPVKRGKRIYGLPVLGQIGELAKITHAYNIDEVVIAMPTATGKIVRAVVESCEAASVPSRTIPGVYELIGGSVSVSRLRRVEITDLLRRAQIGMSDGATTYLAGRAVLVTGAGGSIGREICRQVANARPSQIILLGHGENSIFEAAAQLKQDFPGVPLSSIIADIRDRERILRMFQRQRPGVVLHAAAHKHVPLMEENPEEAVSNNVIGTLNVVDACLASGAERLVLISTDKAVSPASFMGASKRLAELVVREAAARTKGRFVVVRFGNVLGSRGSVVPILNAQIESGGPVTLTHPDMQRFFMTIPEAVHLVLQAGGIAEGGELFALNMGQPVKIVDLAADLIRLSGASPDDIPIVFTGIRPGEKLTEELWEEDAQVFPTAHPDVLRIEERETVLRVPLAQMLREMETAVASGDRPELESLLAACIPTYAPIFVRQGLESRA